MTVYAAPKCSWVHSFEPQLINYERLVKNIELNNLQNVTAYNIALYSKECQMAVNNILNQTGINYESYQACSLPLFENINGDVTARILDSYSFGKIDFIKTDCEGSDYEILLGGIETIKKYRPAIIYEWGKRNSKPQELLISLNYNIKEIASQNFLATPK